MMNHDYAHCLDYVQGVCPPTCFRAELTEDYRKNCNLPVTWAHFSGTKECQYVPWKPTNGDKIRMMTDEELDKFLGDVQWDVANYCGGVTQKQEYPFPEQRGAWLDWLKQEVEPGEVEI